MNTHASELLKKRVFKSKENKHLIKHVSKEPLLLNKIRCFNLHEIINKVSGWATSSGLHWKVKVSRRRFLRTNIMYRVHQVSTQSLWHHIPTVWFPQMPRPLEDAHKLFSLATSAQLQKLQQANKDSERERKSRKALQNTTSKRWIIFHVFRAPLTYISEEHNKRQVVSEHN